MATVLVAIYARYSTDKQDERSIQDQIRRCEEYAQRKGWIVTTRYSDEAVSGTHVDREQLQTLLRAASQRPRPFSIVLVDDLSRLSRNAGDALNLIFDQLAGSSVSVEDCSTGMNTAASEM